MALQTIYHVHDLAIAIDEEGDRITAEAPVSVTHVFRAFQNRVVDVHIFYKLRDFIVFAVHRDTHDLQPIGLVLLVEIHQPRGFDFARSAPGGPEVQQNSLAPIAGELDGLAIRRFKFKIRRHAARLQGRRFFRRSATGLSGGLA